jgi:hypothetical protein
MYSKPEKTSAHAHPQDAATAGNTGNTTPAQGTGAVYCEGIYSDAESKVHNRNTLDTADLQAALALQKVLKLEAGIGAEAPTLPRKAPPNSTSTST